MLKSKNLLTPQRTFSSKVVSHDALLCSCLPTLLAKPREGSAPRRNEKGKGKRAD